MVTDGIRIIAVDTIGYSIPVRKSRLIPRQEQLVYEMVKDVKAEEYEFSQDSLESSKEYHILSLPPQHISGLTRKERQLKQLMFMALDQLKVFKTGRRLRIGIRNGTRVCTIKLSECHSKRFGTCFTMKPLMDGQTII